MFSNTWAPPQNHDASVRTETSINSRKKSGIVILDVVQTSPNMLIFCVVWFDFRQNLQTFLRGSVLYKDKTIPSKERGKRLESERHKTFSYSVLLHIESNVFNYQSVFLN